MKYSTLYKIGFVSDAFAQLQANVSVLSTMKVGEASHDVRYNKCIKCIFDLEYFQFRMSLLGM